MGEARRRRIRGAPPRRVVEQSNLFGGVDLVDDDFGELIPPAQSAELVHALHDRGMHAFGAGADCMHLAAAASKVRPAFADPLTDAERRALLREVFERRKFALPPIPKPLMPEPVVAQLAADVLDRAQRGDLAAPRQRGPLPRWLTHPHDPPAETGADSQTACKSRRPDDCGDVDVALMHVSELTRTELHQPRKYRDIRALRHGMKNSGRSLHRRNSNIRKCGIRRFGNGVEARVRETRGDDGRKTTHGFMAGLVRCGSVWSCPTCAATISGQRARIVTAVIEAHKAQGGWVYMLTLTVRHRMHMPLKALRRSVAKAWQTMQRGKGWARLKEQMGFVGSIKALEVTMGGNGYHPHLHILLAVDQVLEPVDLHELEDDLYERWCSSLRRSSELKGVVPDGEDGRAHGCKLTETEKADYIAKLGLAAELTSGVDKLAKGENRTQFQLLRDYHDNPKGRGADAHSFRRFSRGMQGARQLTWSRTSKKRLAQGAPQTDLRVLYADAIRALDKEPEQPTLTGLESDHELALREELGGATVAKIAGPKWDAAVRVLRSDGIDAEWAFRLTAEEDGAIGLDALLDVVYRRGLQLVATKPYLKKWLVWLEPADDSAKERERTVPVGTHWRRRAAYAAARG